jgi:hypothetical protein
MPHFPLFGISVIGAVSGAGTLLYRAGGSIVTMQSAPP